MSKIDIGKKAPPFTLEGTGGSWSLSDAAGGAVVIYFYPRDNTPGCTQEGADFAAAHAQFKKAKALIVGISADSLAAHEKFKQKMAFPFELLSDPDKKVCKLYDVIQEKSMYGKKFLGIERSTFLIDAQGRAAAHMAQGQGERSRRGGIGGGESTVTGARAAPGGRDREKPSGQARAPHLRAGHECADARSDRHLPLRRARRLHSDDRARGTRRRQEGAVGVGAQCAPGQPLSRRADEGRQQEADRSRARAADRGTDQSRQAPAGRPTVLSNSIAGIRPAGQPARARSGQRHPGQYAGAAAEIPQRQSHPGVERHQFADQGGDPRSAGRGLLQRQDHRGCGPARQRRAAAAAEFLGEARQGHGIVAAAEPHLLSGARAAGARMACQPIRLRSRRERRRSHRPQARGRIGDSGTRLSTTARNATMSGESPRATASRTSR